jgi:DNA-binding transcriptional ArsR family regulator
MPTDEQVGFVSDGFRMLADPTRIKILWVLLGGESSVAHLAEVVGAAPAAVSQHLAKLRLAKLVRVRRKGTFAFYSAVDDHVARLLTEALDHAHHQVTDTVSRTSPPIVTSQPHAGKPGGRPAAATRST